MKIATFHALLLNQSNKVADTKNLSKQDGKSGV